MRGFRVPVSAAVCGIAMTAAAHAADPAGPWRPEFKKPHYTDLISGWYVRGDLGYRVNNIGSVDAPTPATGYNVENGWAAGIGTGYKYKWFRSDVTLDYATAVRFRGDIAAVPEFYRAKVDSFTLLANVYFDLGTWAGLTPYIGAGAGTTNQRIRQYSTLAMIPPAGDGVNDTTRWNLSWAFMGGISYRVSPAMLIDVGYRYLNLGDATSGQEPPSSMARTYFRDVTAQEVRVGLRLMLD
jgi:opacity protein-like surface antigen